MSRSATVGNLPHSAVELRLVGITTSTSYLEVHLQAVLVQRFPQNHNIIDQSVCQAANMGPRECPLRFQSTR
jgi:hypothetical protein